MSAVALAPPMRIADPSATRVCADRDLYDTLLKLDGATIAELGCGDGTHARAIAAAGHDRKIVAFEVDRIQHERNVASAYPANLEFRYGGAEAIDLGDRTVDAVLMFKSLHHVPLAAMDTAFSEIARVLRPGGLAYVSEPVFAGAFNEVIRHFHDEQAVRQAAFDALVRAADSQQFDLVDEVFFLAPVHFDDFAAFEQRIIAATHTEHRLDAATLAIVRQAFEQHLGPRGADFLAPMRVDLLRRR